jgi:hypothetical protein
MISAAELLKESSTVLPVQSSGITTTGLLGIIIMIIIITSWGRLASTLGATRSGSSRSVHTRNRAVRSTTYPATYHGRHTVILCV